MKALPLVVVIVLVVMFTSFVLLDNNTKSLVQALKESFNAKISGVDREVLSLRTDLSHLTQRESITIEQLKFQIQLLTKLQEHVTTLLSQNSELSKQIENMNEMQEKNHAMQGKNQAIQQHQLEMVINASKQAEQQRPKRNVFFDLGANVGDSTLLFVGVQAESLGGNHSLQIYKTPLRVPGPWDIHMYEAHPRFDMQLLDVKKQVEILDTGKYGGPFYVHVHNTTAIGWEEGFIDFYLDIRSDVKWGSSLFKGHPDVNASNPDNVIKVPVHDLCKEILKYRTDDYIIVKIDIEGIEYSLVKELLVRGAFPYIDELYVEYHWFVPDVNEEERCLRGNILETAKKYMRIGPWA